MKVILNKCYGGFNLSKKAHKLYADKRDLTPEKRRELYLDESYRDDPILIEIVEELGDEANGMCADLVVVDIPDDMDYVVDDYDGIETLRPKTPTW